MGYTLKSLREVYLGTASLALLHDQGEWRFCLYLRVALCLLVITHKPSECRGNLVNHLKKGKQTSCCLVLLASSRGAGERVADEHRETMFKKAYLLYHRTVFSNFHSLSTRLINYYHMTYAWEVTPLTFTVEIGPLELHVLREDRHTG